MKKYFVFLFLFASLLIVPISVSAQNEETTTEVIETTEEASPRRPLNADLFQARKNLSDIKNEVKTKRMEAKEEMKIARDDFKLKLQSISDTRKKNVVERIDTRLNNANQKHTDKMAKNLDTLSSILERVSTKAATLKSEGKDTTAVDAAIVNAQTAITTAQTAVTAQAGKDYILTITDETTLGQTISPVVTQFRTDITAAHQTVIAARLAVTEAAKVQKAAMETATPAPIL